MYPFTTTSGIVRNRWYIAAFSDEISRDPIERTILGKPVALYRKQDNTPVAMYGLCPHRYFPLAKGKVQGDNLICGYHGFVFDDSGQCVEVPSQGTSTKFCQPTYPIVELGPFCWIWLGDKSKADLDLIPPYEDFGLNQDGWWHSSENYFHLNGRSQLLIDNLMDLTHLPYVHHHIAGGEAMKNPKLVIEEMERSYRVSRTSKVPFTDFHKMLFGEECRFEGLSEFLSLTDFYGPELIKTCLPITLSIDGQDTIPEGLGTLYLLHGITPETETTTHYFGLSVRNFRLGDAELDEFERLSDIKIRQQDKDAIEAVEERLETASSIQKELLAISDRPATQVRQRIQALLNDEQNEK